MRSRRTSPAWVLLTGLVVASCAAPAVTTTSTTVPATSTSAVAGSTSSAPLDIPPCLAGDQPFATDGALASGLANGQEGDAELVTGLRWKGYEGCERMVVELATAGGAPATEPGEVRAELLRDRGIVRLRLDDLVGSTAIADRVVERPLVDRVYVVRSLAGDLFIDIHLGSGVLARASVNRSPAEIVVDLQPGGSELESRPLVADTIVVASPTGDRGQYPMVLEGYARTFEATVILRIRQGNRSDVEEVTSAADYLVTWGEYRFDIPNGPNGRVEIFVGEDSAQDGEERGVSFTPVMG